MRRRWLAAVPAICAAAAYSAQAQLLDRYLPSLVTTNVADYLRSGSGLAPLPETTDAQAVAPGVTVQNRAQPEYTPLGVRFGSILLGGALSENFGYDGDPGGVSPARGSAVQETNATVRAQTTWSRNGFDVALGVDDIHDFDVPWVSHTDWRAAVGGYLDIGRDRLDVSYSHLNLHVLPTGIDTLGVTRINEQVTPYTVDDLRASYTSRFGRLTLTPSVDYSLYRFGRSDTEAILLGNEAAILGDGNEAANSRNVLAGAATAQFELAPRRILIATVQVSDATFTETGPGVPGRNYRDVQFLVGTDYELDAALRARLLVGFDQRFYGNPAFGNPSEPIAEAQVIWTPTELTTVTATVSRRIEDAVTDGYTLFTYVLGRLQVDHELRRNVVLTGYGQVQDAQYNQLHIGQTLLQAGASATYKLDRNVSVTLSYDFTRQSSIALDQYSRNIGLLQLRFGI